jgi:uncharacterized membrane protein
VLYLALLGGPFALGALLGAALASGWLRVYALFGLGLLIGSSFVLAVYVSSPQDRQHDSSGCSHCVQLWGRWWDPVWAFLVPGIGYFFYLLGIGLGAGARELTKSLRSANAS